MKRVIVACAVILAGLITYNYLTTGELALVPSRSLSEEEQQLEDLGQEFRAARKQFSQANRVAALGGADMTSDADAAMREVERVRRALARLKKRLKSDSARRDAERLERAIEEFRRESR